MSTTLRVFDGDIFLNSAGRSESISGADKATQDIAEVLMTPLDSARDYGSELADLNIPAAVEVFVGKSLVSRKIDEAIQRLKHLQEKDPYATDDETIDSINKLIVDSMGSGDFVFWVSVWLKNRQSTSDSILSVSLRHQESYRFSETIEQTIRAMVSGPSGL